MGGGVTTTMTKHWEDQGLCRHELWRGAWFDHDPTTAAMAIAVCERCPVREICLEKALIRGEQGIWGGKNFSPGRKRPKVSEERTLVIRALADMAWHPRREIITRARTGLSEDRRVELAVIATRQGRNPTMADRKAVVHAISRLLRCGRVQTMVDDTTMIRRVT